MAWTSLTFAFGSVLTSAKQTQLYDNITALANADSGAPPILKHNGILIQSGSATLASTTTGNLSAATDVALTSITTVYGVMFFAQLLPNINLIAADSTGWSTVVVGDDITWATIPVAPSTGNIRFAWFNNTGFTQTCGIRYLIWGT